MIRCPYRSAHVSRLLFRVASSQCLVQSGMHPSAPSRPRSFGSVIDRYNGLVDAKTISDDPRQRKVLMELAKLQETLKSYPNAVPATFPTPKTQSHGFFSMFSSQRAEEEPVEPVYHCPRGIYLYGGPGSGKSFLMDHFYDTTDVKMKCRVHFHEWMIEVHQKLHAFSKENAQFEKANTVWTAEAARKMRQSVQDKAKGASQEDLVDKVADSLMSKYWLLCFDEFQVTHISDALILKRLFSVMFQRGAVVVATSNRPPEDLYLNGLNRSRFEPFIPMLKGRCDVLNIDSEVDYRIISEHALDLLKVYFYPLSTADTYIRKKFFSLTQGKFVTGRTIEWQGRKLNIPECGENVSVAKFDFKDLCNKALGAGDYLALANVFHTIFITDIPILTLQERDQVRRMITLVDTLYERKTKLIISADAPVESLFVADATDKSSSAIDEIFAWDRTVSRLMEMQSQEYLLQRAVSLSKEEYWHQFDLNSIKDEDIEELWWRFDVDRSGSIDFPELKELVRELLTLTAGNDALLGDEELLHTVFTEMDTDGNGVIDKNEFEVFAKKFGFRRLLQ